MNIVVCVKPVPDPGASVGTSVDRATGRVNREGVPLVPNRNDRVALAVALGFREAVGHGQITAILMGPPAAEGAARQCLALGADEAWLVSDRALAGSDALATARALAAAVRRRAAEGAGGVGPVDLVLAGVESSDGGTGQVGPTLAALLGLYHLAQVTALRPAGCPDGGAAGGRLTAEVDVAASAVGDTRAAEGTLVYTANLPLLLTVARTAAKPRTPTAIGIVKARSKPLLTLGCADLGLDPTTVGERGSPTKVTCLLPYTAGRRAEMWGGSPGEQARTAVTWLRDNGFLAGPAPAGRSDRGLAGEGGGGVAGGRG